MEFHQGRLIDHVHLRATDFAASRRFYRAVLGALGRQAAHDSDTAFSSDEFYLDQADGATSHVHLAFQAGSAEMVQAFHSAGLAAGGRDNGGPGERGYHPGYYAAFLLDPDGNNIEAVYHGPTERSAPDVVVRAKF